MNDGTAIDRLNKKLLTLLAVTHCIFFGATLANAQSTISAATNHDSFSVAIANPNTINPRSFIFELRPGEKSEDFLIIQNNADVNLSFELYAADSTKSQEGSFAVKTKQQASENIGQWIHFEKPHLTLEPGKAEMLKFLVDIPSSAAPGKYKGGIATEKQKQAADNAAVTIATRIIEPVEIRVTESPNPVPKKLKITPELKPGAAHWFSDWFSNWIFSWPSGWPQWYFWGSLTLFIISLGLLLWSHFHGKGGK